MSREHHEVVVGTIFGGGGVIEAGERISQATVFTHVAKIVPEMLRWFECNFFSNRVGYRTARWNAAPAEQNMPGPHNASCRIGLKPADFVDFPRDGRELEFQSRFQGTMAAQEIDFGVECAADVVD